MNQIGGTDNNINHNIKIQNLLIIKQALQKKIENNDTTMDVEIAVPLKYLRNFWYAID